MQNAKDTFFEMLRDRVGADASLTVVVRGDVRPAVVVEENELASTVPRLNCYVLRWTQSAVDSNGPMPLEQMRCEIHYSTAGSGAGMDRGRKLSSLDEALQRALQQTPRSAVKKNFEALGNGGEAVQMSSMVWWGDVSLEPVKTADVALERIATVDVWSYQEAGEA